MSDLFHEDVPSDFIDDVFAVMGRATWHVFQVLTKRADRLAEWARTRPGIPPNAWLGVSIESMRYAWRADCLRMANPPVRFISAEPLLGPLTDLDLAGIGWVIAGGESGGSPARALVSRSQGTWGPKPQALEWVRAIRDHCRRADVAFFFKQWGGPRPTTAGRTLDGREWSDYPCHDGTARP